MLAAAVQQDEIRLFAESAVVLRAFFIFGETPFEHLPHGGIVVGAGSVPDREAPIGTFERLSVFEHHHTGDLCVAGGVGNVIAFDIQGRRIQRQQRLQLIERRALSARHADSVRNALGGVVAAHGNKPRLFADLRLHQMHALFALFGQKLLQKCGVLNVAVQCDLRRDTVAHRIILLQKLRSCGGQIFLFIHQKIFLLPQRAVRKTEHLKAAFARSCRNGDDVLLGDGGHDDLLPFAHAANGGDAVAQARRLFKFQRLGGFFHAGCQCLQRAFAALCEQLHRALDPLGISGGGNLAAARRTAAVNVRVETGAHRLPALHEAVPAGGKPEHGGRLVHRLLDVIAAHIRPDIPRAVVRRLLCFGNAGKRRRGDADIVIALVVLE